MNEFLLIGLLIADLATLVTLHLINHLVYRSYFELKAQNEEIIKLLKQENENEKSN